MTEDIDYILQSRSSEDSFIAFVGDNVDHDVATLDGKKTFHGMEAIAAITNKVILSPNSQCIYVLRVTQRSMN